MDIGCFGCYKIAYTSPLSDCLPHISDCFQSDLAAPYAGGAPGFAPGALARGYIRILVAFKMEFMVQSESSRSN
jgi:hypothetical protein